MLCVRVCVTDGMCLHHSAVNAGTSPPTEFLRQRKAPSLDRVCVCGGGTESVLAASSVNTLPGVFVLSGGNPLCSIPSSSPCSARFFASILFRFAGFQAVLSRIGSTFMLSIQEVAHSDCLFARPSALPQLAEQLRAAAEELRLGLARFQ